MAPWRVLVADDQPSVLRPMEYLIRATGADQVYATDNGIDAFRLASLHRPELIVLDVVMPGDNGYDLCRKIRQTYAAAVVWFLSGRGSQIDRALAAEVGAERFIPKPFDPDQIIEMLVQARDAHTARQGTLAGTSTKASTNPQS